jgi:hypothetical protein
MLQILVQKTRFKHVLRRICQGKCFSNLKLIDVSPENFFDPFLHVLKKIFYPPPSHSPTIFGKKIKFEQGISKKKFIDTSKNF